MLTDAMKSAPSGEIDFASAPFEAQEVARRLQEGDPTLGFPADPTLECRVGLVVAADTGVRNGKTYRKGDVVGFRIEVWRHNEDGTFMYIMGRDIDRAHEIIPELAKRRVGGSGFVDGVTEAQSWNDSVEKDRARAVQEAQQEHLEHLWKLVADRQNGKTTFRQMPGLNPDKQD